MRKCGKTDSLTERQNDSHVDRLQGSLKQSAREPINEKQSVRYNFI